MIEPLHTPTVASNIRRHERQINRMGGWQLGDQVIEPGMGSQVFTDAAGNVLFSVSPTDVRVRYQGSTVSLTPLLEVTDQRIKDERTYTNSAVGNAKEQAAAAVAAEAQARTEADTAERVYTNTAIANTKTYADTQVAAEAQSRADADAKERTDRMTETSNLGTWHWQEVADRKAAVSAEAQSRADGDAAERTYTNSAVAGAKTAAQGYANTAEANAKLAAQGYANTAEGNARTYTNTAAANAKAHADAGDTDLANNQIAPLVARLNGLEDRVARIESGT